MNKTWTFATWRLRNELPVHVTIHPRRLNFTQPNCLYLEGEEDEEDEEVEEIEDVEEDEEDEDEIQSSWNSQRSEKKW